MALPIHDPVLVFALVMLIVLVAPLASRKLGVPASVGLIVAGIVVGPHASGFLERDRTIELLGTIGLLYIMMEAGLEIDMRHTRRRAKDTLVFGLLTFALPLGLGILAGSLALGLDFLPALLLASLFSSHTLLSFPTVVSSGLSKRDSVATVLGGTIVTDTLAFVILAVVAAAAEGRAGPAMWLSLGLGAGAFAAGTLLILPRLGRWFLKRFSSPSGVEEYVFMIASLFASASLSHFAGLEPIIGAFVAGIALASIVPEGSVLRNRFAFIGDALFIPFFLLSVGMIVDPAAFVSGWDALIAAGTMTLVAVGAKLLAAVATGKLLNFTKSEIGLAFGMSVNQAAATLAAAMVGLRLGIFDETIISGVIVMIAVTCVIGAVATSRYAKRVAEESSTAPAAAGAPTKSRILVALANPGGMEALVDLALAMAAGDGAEAIYPMSAVIEGPGEDARVAEAEALLTKAQARIGSAGMKALTLTRLSSNAAEAIARAAAENRIGKALLGPSSPSAFRRIIAAPVLSQLLERSKLEVLVPRLIGPLGTAKRLVAIAPPLAHLHPGTGAALRDLSKLAKALSARFVVAADGKEAGKLPKVAGAEALDAGPWAGMTARLAELLGANDIIAPILFRKGELAWSKGMEGMPEALSETFPKSALLCVYPGIPLEALAEAGDPSKAAEGIVEWRTIDAEGRPSLIELFEAIGSEGPFDDPGEIAEGLWKAATRYPIPLNEGTVLIHARAARLTGHYAFVARKAEGFGEGALSAGTLIALVSPADDEPERHLAVLGAIANAVKKGGAEAKLGGGGMSPL
jgi:Kef-type K+ transport system membrane component KefB